MCLIVIDFSLEFFSSPKFPSGTLNVFHRMKAAEVKLSKRVKGLGPRDRISNEDIRNEMSMYSMNDKIPQST